MKIARIRGNNWRKNRTSRYYVVTMRLGSDRSAKMPTAWRINDLAKLALSFRYA